MIDKNVLDKLTSLNITEQELQVLERELKSYRAALAIQAETTKQQETCVHKWEYSGHGHNDDHYICSVCGKWKFE